MNITNTTADNLLNQYRGELAAVESYIQALNKYEGQPEEDDLRTMLREHRDAANRLGVTLRRNGFPLPAGSGAWGTLASTAERVAAMVNDQIPLQLLRQGEAIGVSGYDKLLAADDLGDALFVELAALRSRCRTHMHRLDLLVERVPEIQTRPMI